MLKVDEFISRYEKYSDEELFNIYSEIEGYSDDAIEAFNIVVAKRGGIDYLKNETEKKKKIDAEILKIKSETKKLCLADVDVEFIKKTTTSDILTKEQVGEIIEEEHALAEAILEDRKLTPKTITLGVISALVSGITGGILWGLQMIYSNAVFYIFGIGLVLYCYGVIRLITKKSKNNTAVFIATFFAVVLALIIGQYLYEYIGYKP